MTERPSFSPPPSLWSIAAVLLRYRTLLLVLPITLAALVATFTLMSPRRYRAGAAFMPQESSARAPSVSQLAAQFGLTAAAGGATTSPQFYADLLESKELLREVATTRYATPTHRGTLIEYFRYDRESGGNALLRTLEKLRSSTVTQANRVTGVVSVEVETRDPALSEQVVDRMLALLNDYNLRRRQSQARAEREFVQARLAESAAELAVAEKALTDFHAANRIIAAPRLRAVEEQLQRQVLLRQELYTTLASNYEAARIDEVRSTPVITVIQRPAGFVEPVRRFTIRKTIVAGFAGGVIAVVLAFLLEYLARARAAGGREFGEVAQLWGQTRLALSPARLLRRG